MVPSQVDRDIAAVLVIALKHAGIQPAAVVARVDAELVMRRDPPAWLADASLAKSRDQLESVLAAAAGAHSTLTDPWAIFDVLATVRDRRALPTDRAVKFVLGCWQDGTLPKELVPLVGDVYEDGFCAHDFEEVQPERAERALGVFLAAARGRSTLSEAVARMADAGWV
jgi:hypothetical protein